MIVRGRGGGGNRCKRRLALFYKHFERHTGCKGRLSGVICRTCKSVNHCHQASKSGNVELLVTADKFSSFRSKEYVLTTESEYHEVVSCHSQSCTTYRFPIIDSKQILWKPNFLCFLILIFFLLKQCLLHHLGEQYREAIQQNDKRTHLVWRALLNNGITLLQSHSWWCRHLVSNDDFRKVFYTATFEEKIPRF